MTASRHTRLQNQFAGANGKKEVPIKINGKLRRRDVMTPKKVIEVERTGQSAKIELALRRLQASKKPHKILKVPNKDLSLAAKIRGSRSITVSNLKNSKYR